MKPEELELYKKKWSSASQKDPIDVANEALEDVPALLSALEAAQRECDQANEAVKTLSKGKPLGPLVGSHTIVNQALEIHRLTKELEAARAKLAAAEKARDTWEHALKCRDRQFREFMDKWEEATEFTETLKEKLESAQEENRRLREALEDIKIRSRRIQEDKAVVGIEAGFIWQIARRALARPEKEGGG